MNMKKMNKAIKQILKLEQGVRQEIILSLQDLSVVKEVHEIGSAEFQNQFPKPFSDCDLLIVVGKCNRSEFEELKIVLTFLLKKYPELFKHKFLIFPEQLAIIFIKYNYWWINRGRELLKDKRIQDKNLYKLAQYFEWLLVDYFVLRRNSEDGIYGAQFDKLKIRTIFYLAFIKKNFLRNSLDTQFINNLDHNQYLFYLKSEIEKMTKLFLKQMGVRGDRVKILLHQNWYGYMIYLPKFHGAVSRIVSIFSKKWALRIMDRSVLSFLELYKSTNNRNFKRESAISKLLENKRKFYREWIKFIIKNKLMSVANPPHPYRLFQSGWVQIWPGNQNEN